MFSFIPKIKQFIESVHALIKILDILIKDLKTKDKNACEAYLDIISSN